jgi:hypothetical protein
VYDSKEEGKSEIECHKCSKEFKHEIIERFLEDEKEKKLLNYFKSLWNPLPPSQERMFAICCAYL